MGGERRIGGPDALPVRGVIFDLFHTLTGLSSERNSLPRTCDTLGIDRARWDELLSKHSRWRLSGLEKDPYRILSALAQEAGASVGEERLREAVRVRTQWFRESLMRVPSENVVALRQLRGAGYRLGLISNADAMEVAAWSDSPLAGLFDAEVFSCAVGYVKPEREIYETCLATLGLSAGECLFVGDGGANEHAGAREVGMSTVLVSGVLSELWPERLPERVLLCDHHVQRIPEVLALLGL